MEKILQRIKQKSFCHNCKNEIEHTWICKMDSVIGIRYALLCPNCQKLIRIYCSSDFNELFNVQKI
jgi:hypothetical protein